MTQLAVSRDGGDTKIADFLSIYAESTTQALPQLLHLPKKPLDRVDAFDVIVDGEDDFRTGSQPTGLPLRSPSD